MLVDVVPIGEVTAQAKREISAALRTVYDADVSLADTQAVPEAAYDDARYWSRARSEERRVGKECRL